MELDPRLPVNLTEKLAKIPVLLIYGADDLVVPPADNCELFAERFRKHGGSIQIVKRPSWGHHPHGLDDPAQIVEFMNSPSRDVMNRADWVPSLWNNDMSAPQFPDCSGCCFSRKKFFS